jgi:peptidoglycan/xylan/chitin deacetylase (PgdA/CDA1 family)
MTKDVRIALTFDFDAYSLWIGTFDSNSPSMLSRGEFGPVGVRRILAALEAEKIPATFYIPGHTAYAFPKTVEAVAAAGHEIGHHGWVHENPASVSPEKERWILEKGFEALDKVAGVRPTGYRSPAWDNSPQTVPLLLEHGFEYESSMMGSDFQPYWCRIGDSWSKDGPYEFGKPVDLVEMPVAWHLDDFPQFEYVVGKSNTNQGVLTPRDLLQMWKDEFDYLYDRIGEGVFIATMHPQTVGRGHRMLLLEQFIDYVKDKPGVSFTRMGDYARHWKTGKTPSLPADTADSQA